MSLLPLVSTDSDCCSLEYRGCSVQFNSEYRLDVLGAVCTGGRSRARQLDLLAGDLTTAGGKCWVSRGGVWALEVYQGEVVACVLISIIFASIDY